jgi:ABC-type transport system substrate-binding protein
MLSRIALIKEVAGIQVPGTPWATPPAELEKLAGYGRDIAKNRAEAKRLLKEAGVPNLKLKLGYDVVTDEQLVDITGLLLDKLEQAIAGPGPPCLHLEVKPTLRACARKHPIGAGPYKFVSFTPGVELVMEAFDEREDNLSAIAAPVFAGGGELVGIIGVQGPASRFDAAARRAASGSCRPSMFTIASR